MLGASRPYHKRAECKFLKLDNCNISMNLIRYIHQTCAHLNSLGLTNGNLHMENVRLPQEIVVADGVESFTLG
jgi:hypothetical protein